MINWEAERAAIAAAAHEYNLDPLFIESIRVAANGGPGREFGVWSVPAPDFESQLRICCQSVAHSLAQCPRNPLVLVNHRSHYGSRFVVWFALKWPPPADRNDPVKVNTNWFNDCWNAYTERIRDEALTPEQT